MTELGRISAEDGESIPYRFPSLPRGPAHSLLARPSQVHGGNHIDRLIAALL